MCSAAVQIFAVSRSLARKRYHLIYCVRTCMTVVLEKQIRPTCSPNSTDTVGIRGKSLQIAVLTAAELDDPASSHANCDATKRQSVGCRDEKQDHTDMIFLELGRSLVVVARLEKESTSVCQGRPAATEIKYSLACDPRRRIKTRLRYIHVSLLFLPSIHPSLTLHKPVSKLSILAYRYTRETACTIPSTSVRLSLRIHRGPSL
jgi:hypothetical protein